MEAMNEFSLSWLKGDKRIAVTAPTNSRLKNKIVKLAEDFPDDVQIVVENNDGSIFAYIPVNYFAMPRKPREISEEERQRLSEMAKQNAFFNNHLPTNDQIEELDEQIEEGEES